MRIAAGLFIGCALIVLISVFLPALRPRAVHGFTIRRASVSLYKASTDRELARALFGKYTRSSSRRIGESVTNALVPRLGKNKAHLDDAQDAMQTLDQFDDDDVRHAGWALTAAVWFLILASLAMVVAFAAELSRKAFRPRRALVVAIGALVVAILAVGAHLGCREAVWQANDEIGYETLELGLGAYLLAISGCAAFLAAGVTYVLARKRRL